MMDEDEGKITVKNEEKEKNKRKRRVRRSIIGRKKERELLMGLLNCDWLILFSALNRLTDDEITSIS